MATVTAASVSRPLTLPLSPSSAHRLTSRDVAVVLVADDDGLQRHATAEHDGEPHAWGPSEPLAVDGDGAAAGRVQGAAGGWVDEEE
jgi:hypothetical protein